MYRFVSRMILAGWLAVGMCGWADAEPAASTSDKLWSTQVWSDAEYRSALGACWSRPISASAALRRRSKSRHCSTRARPRAASFPPSGWAAAKTAAWEPKCYIVLHPTAESYLREVGEGQMTAGSSLIEFAGNRLVTRRVDLRADHPDGYLGALAHELTHVVVADRFVERQIPRWADEGMAVLADTQGKQDLHHADLGVARANRTTFRLVELMQLENYPDASRQGNVLRSERVAGAVSGRTRRRAGVCRLSDEVERNRLRRGVCEMSTSSPAWPNWNSIGAGTWKPLPRILACMRLRPWFRRPRSQPAQAASYAQSR